MEQRRVGRSGLRVSRLGLGTLTWGRDTDEHEAGDLLRTFLDAGGTLVDTAPSYGDGRAEAVVGALLEHVPREDVVLCTKGGADPSRRGMLAALDASLARLRTDHVDLWLAQGWAGGRAGGSAGGWADGAPVEEVLSALLHAQASGRARYVGVANLAGWQTARAASLAPDLVATQVEYSLLQRGVEREVLPAADDLGLGVLAWSPLGRGVLTGKYRGGTPADSRAASPHLVGFVEPYLDGASRRVVDAVVTAAEGLEVAPAEIALSWVRDRPGVAAALVGARTAAQLRGSLASEDVVLPAEIRAALDEVGAPAVGYPERS